ncbi:hypothetical protein [Gloeobacter violaceus]|uniref:Gsl4133 protein n=1 Tax=Gloeobacter violaceus (strain ATCC 29082 / PCC 7421) TaxID=251221 RepID=Q7NDU9_GLOVI|nr:hypothetical protein [Gloeobacter violaceus]BAC92074.1 gsl4133 [Gloeobacter violaceus PCC 7421]
MELQRPFRRYRCSVQRGLDRWPQPGNILLNVPELGPGSRWFVCPRCEHKWSLTPEDILAGTDEAPTLLGEAVCPACGAHYHIEQGRIRPLPDIELRR